MNCNEKQIHNVEKHRKLIFEAEKYIWKHPETGYREWNTSAYLEKEFTQLGYSLVRAGNIPGFYTDLDTGRPGPTVLVIGEMDSLICKNHPDADPETFAAHACGHHAQCASLLGLAAALKEPGALSNMCGRIRIMAVPAEESIELDFRENLKRQKIIRYFSGKMEFMYRGFMEGVDMAFLVHGLIDASNHFRIRKGSNGSIVKSVNFQGVSAHAGSVPYLGVNALYAANLGLNAINTLRETFKEGDQVRVHPIIVKGGNTANAIPDEVALECFVRGQNINVIVTTNDKINRALAGAAASIGAKVAISDCSFCFPLDNDDNLISIAETAIQQIVPRSNIQVYREERTASSTDMGDLSAVMPAIQIYCSGAAGTSHGSDYRVSDVESACVNATKCQVMMLELLLGNGAAAAKKVINEKKITFNSIQEYFLLMDKLITNRDAVIYNEDDTVTLQYKSSHKLRLSC